MEFSKFQTLIDTVQKDSRIALVSFESDRKENTYRMLENGRPEKVEEASTELITSVDGKKSTLVINGTFRLVQAIAGEFSQKQVVAERLSVEKRWGGDVTLHRLVSLLPAGAKGEPDFFVVILSSSKTNLLEGLFVGPVVKENIVETGDALRFLASSHGKVFSESALLKMLKSGRVSETLFALRQMEKEAAICSARHFLLAIESLPSEYSADIARELFKEARRNRNVKETTLDAIQAFLDTISPDKGSKLLHQLGEAIDRFSWAEENVNKIAEMTVLLQRYQRNLENCEGADDARKQTSRILRLLAQ